MPAPLTSYRGLRAWKCAVDLAVECHRIANSFPAVQRFGLGAQLRRAAGSVPANIAEGYGRLHRREYLYHLSVANGSLKELETHLVIAARLGLIIPTRHAATESLCAETGRLLLGLIASLREERDR